MKLVAFDLSVLTTVRGVHPAKDEKLVSLFADLHIAGYKTSVLVNEPLSDDEVVQLLLDLGLWGRATDYLITEKDRRSVGHPKSELLLWLSLRTGIDPENILVLSATPSITEAAHACGATPLIETDGIDALRLWTTLDHYSIAV